MNPQPTNRAEKQLKILFEHYRSGRLNDAEKLARSITKETPLNEDAWKALWAILQKIGKTKESLTAIQKAVQVSPSDAKVRYSLGYTLLELGKLETAQETFRKAISLKPDYAEAYYLLGETVKKLGKLEEAERTYSKAIALKPNYGKAYFNLGDTLQKLGKLEKAEKSYRQAIEFYPSFHLSYYNLAEILHKQDRLNEAEACHRQVIKLKPDFAEAYSDLGVMLKKQGRLNEAESSYNKAIQLKPQFAQAHNNLGIMLKELGRLQEAEASHKKAIELNPSYAGAMFNLSVVHRYKNSLNAEIRTIQKLLSIKSVTHHLPAKVLLAICRFLEGKFTESKKHLLAATKIKEQNYLAFKNEQVYREYLLKIINWHEDNDINYKQEKNEKTLYVLGESHSLVNHQLRIEHLKSVFFCKSSLIKGCMQWHLGNSVRNQYKDQFEGVFSSLPKCSEILLTIGEIDCRLNNGIIKYSKKFPEKDLDILIETTVKNYLNYVSRTNSNYKHNIIIQGVPCPNIEIAMTSSKNVSELIKVIKTFNFELKSKSREKGFGFLDVHKLTDRGDGFSNGIWHIDQFHLSPKGVLEAWNNHITSF